MLSSNSRFDKNVPFNNHIDNKNKSKKIEIDDVKSKTFDKIISKLKKFLIVTVPKKNDDK